MQRIQPLTRARVGLDKRGLCNRPLALLDSIVAGNREIIANAETRRVQRETRGMKCANWPIPNPLAGNVVPASTIYDDTAGAGVSVKTVWGPTYLSSVNDPYAENVYGGFEWGISLFPNLLTTAPSKTVAVIGVSDDFTQDSTQKLEFLDADGTVLKWCKGSVSVHRLDEYSIGPGGSTITTTTYSEEWGEITYDNNGPIDKFYGIKMTTTTALIAPDTLGARAFFYYSVDKVIA